MFLSISMRIRRPGSEIQVSRNCSIIFEQVVVPARSYLQHQSYNSLFIIGFSFIADSEVSRSTEISLFFTFVIVETRKKINSRNTQSIKGDIDTSGSSSLLNSDSLISLIRFTTQTDTRTRESYVI